MKVICDYCNKEAEYIDSKFYYSNGVSYGMIYWCRPCDAIVGVHKGTPRPLGRLANRELRAWKKKAHAVFDPLWKNGKMSRSRAYLKLADIMGLPLKDAHIGMFDVEQCKKVVESLTPTKT